VIGRRLHASALVLAAGLALAGASRAAPSRLDARAADTLIARRQLKAKDVERWVKDAGLADLVWILRRPSAELGEAEAPLLEAAARKTPPARAALKARLDARLTGLGGNRKSARPGGAIGVPRPRASVFRVSVVLPSEGDYADYGHEVIAGLEMGIASVPAAGHPIELDWRPSGDADPSRVAAILESQVDRSGALIGELLSVNTFALATGARLLGLPLISPTATDEAIGLVGPQIFQVGPSGWARGERLARYAGVRAGTRVGALVLGSLEASPLALGFCATAESLGATVVWRSGYPAGTGFREEVKQIAAHPLDVLVWDGDSREAETLLRELSRQKVALALCGSEALAPERLHAETRVLLEGVRYVADEWKLTRAVEARLDSAGAARGISQISPLHVRGWLAGRALASAVAGGALCPEEVADALRTRCASGPWLGPRRFLEVVTEGATLPVYQIARGRASAVEEGRQ
jgi:ABC-type branched-subunit amino acid transport system substrate-binding protein